MLGTSIRVYMGTYGVVQPARFHAPDSRVSFTSYDGLSGWGARCLRGRSAALGLCIKLGDVCRPPARPHCTSFQSRAPVPDPVLLLQMKYFPGVFDHPQFARLAERFVGSKRYYHHHHNDSTKKARVHDVGRAELGLCNRIHVA